MNISLFENVNSVHIFDMLVPRFRDLLASYEENRKVDELKKEIADIVLENLGIVDLTSDKVTTDLKENVLTQVRNMKVISPIATPQTQEDPLDLGVILRSLSKAMIDGSSEDIINILFSLPKQ